MFAVASKLPGIKAKKNGITLAEFDVIMRLVAIQQSRGSIDAGITEHEVRVMSPLPPAELAGGSGSGSSGSGSGSGSSSSSRSDRKSDGGVYQSHFAEIDTSGAGTVKLAQVIKFLKARIDGKVLKAMFAVASRLPRIKANKNAIALVDFCLLYTSPSPRDRG